MLIVSRDVAAARLNRVIVAPVSRTVRSIPTEIALGAGRSPVTGFVVDADLPEAGVSGEAGQVSAAADVGLDRGALTGRPVLVVADVDDQVVAVGDRGVVVEVGRDAHVELSPTPAAL